MKGLLVPCAALCCAVVAVPVTGQVREQPYSVSRVAYRSDYYNVDDADAASAGDTASESSTGCDPCGPSTCCVDSCDSCGCGGLLGGGLFCCELGDPFKVQDILFSKCQLENGWTFGGHTQMGYQDGPDGSFTGNGPFLSQKEWNNVNLNQQYFFLGKTADGEKGLDFGFRADMMYGVDGNEGQAFGNVNAGHFDYLNGWDHGSYEWAMPQLYAEVAVGDMTVKAGRFYTLVGYEVLPSTGNFFLSRHLTFWNSQPFTHTGVLTSYKASDKLTLNGGWVLGMDTGYYQFLKGNAFLGGFTYQVNDDVSLVYAMTGGDLGWRGNGAINGLILNLKWSDKITTAHTVDVLSTDLRVDANGVPTDDDGGTPADFATAGGGGGFIPRDSFGSTHYGFYELSPCLKAGTRFEWFKADGISYYTWSNGVNIKPAANLIVRPEVRHMWAPGNEQIYTGSGFNDELFNNTVIGADAILTF